jgi:CBS domain-containing protein
LVGELSRDHVPESAAKDQPASAYAERRPPAIAPGAAMQTALETMASLDCERLMVVDDDRRLAGLLCLNRRHGRFCVDG